MGVAPWGDGGVTETDLWFLPGPLEEEPESGPPPPPTRSGDVGSGDVGIVAVWARAEADLAARLARVTAAFGALDERLRRGPTGWRHRLALIEAAELSWLAGDRVAPDRLALWIALRLAGAQADPTALARMGWAVRRLTGGPGPETVPECGPAECGPAEFGPAEHGPGRGSAADVRAGLAAFLGRHPSGASGTGASGTGAFGTSGFGASAFGTADGAADCLADRMEAWGALMQAAGGLHPVSRATLGYHQWPLAGLGDRGDRIEAAVTAARLAAAEAAAAVFVPLAMGGGAGLRAMGGPPAARLAAWLEGMEGGVRSAMRQLDGIEAWSAHAAAAMAGQSGRTPRALRAVLAEWPLVSAPMAERLTGASRAAVQRSLAAMEVRGLVREVTGQGRFRMWRAAIPGPGGA